MKWVRRVLGLLVALPMLAAIGLLAAGQRPGAGRAVASADIARPAPMVFHYFEDAALLRTWTRLVEIRPTPWLRPGTHATLVAQARSQRIETDCEVREVVAARRVALTLRSLPSAQLAFEQRLEYELTPVPDGTRLTVSAVTDLDGALPRLFEPLITRAVSRQLEAQLRRLEAVAEAGPSAPPPAE